MPQTPREISQALILATGTHDTGPDGPTPLTTLLGRTLLGRTLLTLQRAELTEAYVVVREQSEGLRRSVEGIPNLTIRVHWLVASEVGPGILAARPLIRQPFVLARATQIFDPAIVAALVRDFDPGDAVRLAAGRRIAASPADSEAGLMVATPALFAAIEEVGDGPEPVLAGAIRLLATRGLVRTTTVDGALWHPIDTGDDLVRAEHMLLRSVRKSTDGPISRYLNRPISILISRRLVNTSITANQVTLFNLLLGLVTGGLAMVGGYVAWLATAILFHITSILDGVDGELAKLTLRGSKRGEWFDTTADQTSYLVFLLGLVIGVRRSALPDFFFVIGIIGFITAFISITNITVHLLLQKKSGSFLAVRYGFETGRGWRQRALKWLGYLGKRDMMAFLTLILGIIGQLQMVLALFGVIATIFLLPASFKPNIEFWIRSRRRRRAVRRRREREVTVVAVDTPRPPQGGFEIG